MVKTKVIVDDVELTVEQIGNSVSISRVIGRDRKRGINITSGCKFNIKTELDPPAIAMVTHLRRVAKYQTARCTCGYHYGWSDHAEHCQSIHVACEYRGDLDE